MQRSRPSRPGGAARRLVAAGLGVLALLLAPSGSRAAEPPNPNDPCSSAGRNTCGTLGVGFYREYRYGIRWLGDFRGAVPGRVQTFCLDLGYWYASRAYRYRAKGRGELRNRDGELVPLERQQKLAYAIWTYGRSSRPAQQAAVALYVHSQMGDARPGEADPDAFGDAVASTFERVARDAARFHGPYRIEIRIVGPLVVGKPAGATIRVLSAEGHPLPELELRLSAREADGLPVRARTNAQGVVSVPLTPTSAGRLRLAVETGPLASTLPEVFKPTTAAAAPNGQRLAAPSSQRVSTTVAALVTAAPTVTIALSDEVVRPGAPILARIRTQGLGRTPATIRVELFGPFATRSAIRCDGRRYWTRTVTARGDGTLSTPSVELARAGFYSYRVRVVGSPLVAEHTTECGLDTATALASPRIVTGRGDVARAVPLRVAGRSAPTRVRLATVGIDAPVAAVGIDLARGVLGVPRSIARAGWWKDGMAPGARSGAILIAGHVDSARGGVGAFFSLRRARPDDRVQIETGGGRTFTYRVVSVRTYRKTALPPSIFSRSGRARLVLVTCGGPFDPKTRRYRDNVVVTAVP